MPLQHLGFIDLPAHAGDGGFDHAAVHEPTGRIYVAHTANDAVDVIDIEARKYVGSIEGLTAVAGALVAEPDLVFTSNRGENTVGIFTRRGRRRASRRSPSAYARTGWRTIPAARGSSPRTSAIRPSPARAPSRSSTSEPDSAWPTSPSPAARAGPSTIRVADAFHVNIADPPQIVVVGAGDPVGIRRVVRDSARRPPRARHRRRAPPALLRL